MIAIKNIGPGKCSQCNTSTPVTLQYEFNQFFMNVCKDCSKAIGDLHYACMQKGESYKYENDDIRKVECEDGFREGELLFIKG